MVAAPHHELTVSLANVGLELSTVTLTDIVLKTKSGLYSLWTKGSLSPPGPQKTIGSALFCRRWRLFDCSWAALRKGNVPFYVPPEFFIYRYFPLEEHWQLLSQPVGLEAFWNLPLCSLLFLDKQIALLDDSLRDTEALQPGREGDPMPTIMIPLRAPEHHGFRHALLDDQLRPVIEPREGGHNTLLFQKRLTEEDDTALVVTQLWTAIPHQGTFFIEVNVVEEEPRSIPIHVYGLDAPIVLHVDSAEPGFRIKVTVPSPVPHDPKEGLRGNPFTPIAFQADTHPTVISLGCKLAELVDFASPGEHETANGHPPRPTVTH
eukprot:evm.model.scf_1892.2 EVM.evm.TU.scf_1892.2   scf_1892:12548-15209(+)